MRVFVTGATGFIGSAIVDELRKAGHDVLALARSDAAAAALARSGVKAHKGDLSDLDSLAAGALACDGVIHTAFIHDFSRYEANAETDRVALEAMAGAMEGSNKPLIVTSGTAVLPPGALGLETEAPASEGLGAIRAKSELVLAAAERGVRVSVIRLPPSVHGRGDKGFLPTLIDLARRTGVSAYVEDGSNRWPAVHRLDAARLFRHALEAGHGGVRYHGVAEEGLAFRAIAEAIGQGLGVPTKSLGREDTQAHFDWMALFAGADMAASSAWTRDQLNWHPREEGLLADLQSGGYFT